MPPETYLVTPIAAYFIREERLCAAPVNEDDTVDWDHGGAVDFPEAARTQEELTLLQQLPFMLVTLDYMVAKVLTSVAGA